MIRIERSIGGDLEANCWIIHHGEGSEAFIIDPGYNHKTYMAIASKLKLRPKAILLTHHHRDHAGAANVLAGEFDAPVYLHERELPYYRGKVDVAFEGGETLYLAGGAAAGRGEPVELLHTPGHSAGGACFYLPRSKVSFTGDTIFNIDLGYTCFAGGSDEDMRASLRNVVDKWSNEVTIYPGHGDPATMKYVRKYNREFIDMVGD
jgi:glyoxylase-like metal-dependent hydrolase (beta-lactamase superfamily II)